MYADVLVTTDGSDPAEAAAAHAIELASRFGATVHLLHVVDTRLGAVGLGRGAESALASLRANGEAALDRLRSRAEAADVAVTVELDEGSPLAVIADRAADCDLVVVGTHGRTGLRRFVLGSVAEALVTDPPTPLLVVPPDEHPVSYRDVLVGTDGGATAGLATDHAVAVADRYAALLHAVSVVDERLDRTSPVRAALERAASEAVRDVAAAAAERDVTVETRVLTGVPAEELLDAAERRTADLIVVGTRGGGSLDRLAVGSVARRIVRAGQAPTLVVPGPEEGADAGEGGRDEATVDDVRASGLDWTVLRAPRLTDGEATGSYELGYLDLGPGATLGRADAAAAMLDVLEAEPGSDGAWVGEFPHVTGR